MCGRFLSLKFGMQLPHGMVIHPRSTEHGYKHLLVDGILGTAFTLQFQHPGNHPLFGLQRRDFAADISQATLQDVGCFVTGCLEDCAYPLDIHTGSTHGAD